LAASTPAEAVFYHSRIIQEKLKIGSFKGAGAGPKPRNTSSAARVSPIAGIYFIHLYAGIRCFSMHVGFGNQTPFRENPK
jgi:hypothetical protein